MVQKAICLTVYYNDVTNDVTGVHNVFAFASRITFVFVDCSSQSIQPILIYCGVFCLRTLFLACFYISV